MVAVRAEPHGGGWTCQVRVDHGGHRSEHTVGVSEADVARWAGGTSREDVEDLVSRSFEFLLEREPAGSILRTFDLAVIGAYFPEYAERFKR